MADDIDDLLDEVETKYCPKDRRKGKETSSSIKSSHNASFKRKYYHELINLEDAIITSFILQPDVKPIKSNGYDARTETARKCYPIYVGGANCSCGMGTSMSQKTCDKMRCTSCDFKVVSFDNFEWTTDTDYLFLRNHAPDFQKLKSNLNSRKGYRAYCCQCSFRSIKELTQLKDPQLKWVCGKH
ncbi:cilia- and flagella-associated protein 418-like [Mytilus galloprovincialis]|uniref:cilia- and flagella-associated protein 418-like n=1 Tax=Mytilus galloprovincialis TaxID=29158 RepID=UPI003F7C1313